MKYGICFVLFLLLLAAPGIAQTKTRFKFTSINQVGILAGESLSKFQIQSINGVSYKSFVAGVGLGLDDYYQRSFPVFIDLRKRFFKKESAPFVYADAGYSFISKNSMTEWEMDRNGGAYYAAGIGYEISVSSKIKAVIDIGYSYKHYSRIIDNQPWRSSEHFFDTFEYSLNRISIKGGLRF